MTTSVVTLTEAWILINSGAVVVSPAVELVDAGAIKEVAENPEFEKMFVHIGTVAPAADTFAYDEFKTRFSYGGSEDVYMRTHKGERVIKVTPVA